MKLYWIRVDPTSHDWCLYVTKERAVLRPTPTHTGGKIVMQRQGQTFEWCSYKPRNARIVGSRQKLGKGKEEFFPRVLKRSWLLFTPWFWSSNLQKLEKINFYCFNTPVAICYSNSKKQYSVAIVVWWCFLFNYMFTKIRNCTIHPSSSFSLLLFSYHPSHLSSPFFFFFDFRNMWNLNMHAIYLLTSFLNFQMTPWDNWLKGYFRGTQNIHKPI